MNQAFHQEILEEKRKQDDGLAVEVGNDPSHAKQTKQQNHSPPQCGTGDGGGKLATHFEMYIRRTLDTSEEDICGLVTGISDGVELVDAEVIAELKDQHDKLVSKVCNEISG